MTADPQDIDLGSFEDEKIDAGALDDADAAPALNVEAVLADLGDEYRCGPHTYALAHAMTAAREAAVQPKPEIKEMIETLTRLRYRLDDRELRLLATGDRTEPYAPTMREAAVLGAAANFLEIINANKAAVKRALDKRV